VVLSLKQLSAVVLVRNSHVRNAGNNLPIASTQVQTVHPREKIKVGKGGSVVKMKLAVSARGPKLEDPVDPRFGRAKWIIIYDDETGNFEPLDNAVNYNAAEGAGIKAAELVVNKHCQVVITGYLGPKAFRVLSAADIKGYVNAKGSVREAIEAYENDQLSETSEPTVKGHW